MKKFGQVVLASALLLSAGATQAGESYAEIYDYLYGKFGNTSTEVAGGNTTSGEVDAGNGGAANGGAANGGAANGGAANGGDVAVVTGATEVPELDALGAPLALSLVAGIGGLAIERRRRQSKK